MEKKWTAAQLSAIESKGRDLLVSAGAGSGKTAVLTERIIRRLTDKENPADITRMLVVTFTHAAAGELKERIGAAITKALADDPKNKHLSRQLFALDRAKISTIHSFCLDVLRENADAVGLTQGFRIADATEIELLRREIMDELLDDYFADAVTDYQIEGFTEFADTFVGTKGDDSLADIFLKIESDLSSYTEHIDFVKRCADELTALTLPFERSAFGEEILSLVCGKFKVYRDIFAAALPDMYEDAKLAKAYAPQFSDDIDFMDRVISACERAEYFDVADIFKAYTPAALKASTGAAFTDAATLAKETRSDFTKDFKDLKAKCFSLTENELAATRIDSANALYKLHTLLSAFVERFAKEKNKHLLVDFNDLERLAYKVLVSESAPTEVAKLISERFDEIYIDEYQDVNAVQDAIFSAIGNGHNRFMVGDIKQSIYSFRGAAPYIFAAYRRDFGSLDDGEAGGAAVFLSNNFRCDAPVIDFTNIISRCLFTSGRGDIPFTKEDELIHSKSDTEQNIPVHVVLVGGSEDTDEGEEEEVKDSDVSSAEAEYVAVEIARLLSGETKNNGEPIRPSDIAIIMRSEKSHSEALGAALGARGIPFYSSSEGDFFENAEVLLALCMLNVIDNPTRDIYLAGALKSPVYGFTLDELVRIRRDVREGSLFDALRKYTDEHSFKKGREFLADLEYLREKAQGMPVDRLLWLVYQKTDLLSLVYDKENATRRANLMLLYEYARQFEGSSFKGLYNFIRYVNDILDQNKKLKTAQLEGEASDTVKLMTIHHSKGLEYPVCFICGTGKKFNDQDQKKNIVIERGLGMSLKLSDETGFARYDTPIRRAIVSRLGDTQLEEEMRNLYVALTRSRERLYVTAITKDPDKLLEAAKQSAKHLSRYTVMKNGGYMKWILTSLMHHELTDGEGKPYVIDVVTGTPEATEAVTVTETVAEAVEVTDEMRKLIGERFDFVYPKSEASRLPAKLSVSKLVPTLLDEDAAELTNEYEPYSFEKKRPMFFEHDAAPTVTGAERGTATHLFMQFCDFSRFESCEDIAATAQDEATRLAEKRFITARMASLVNVRQVAGFFTSDTFGRIRTAKNVWREHRFNVKLPASDFTENEELKAALDGELVLVQGVIDCFFENPDGSITLIDYKTDFIPPELDLTAASKLLLERHRLQLLYYKEACERISAKKVSSVQIYSFALGKAIDVI